MDTDDSLFWPDRPAQGPDVTHVLQSNEDFI
jgi:hypothetical protein